ncbi:MAG: DUF1003 domain-containing protein [Myxococcales bacterium]|nr:DUF1003 domain-containing protein [Myxococcales bacterium]
MSNPRIPTARSDESSPCAVCGQARIGRPLGSLPPSLVERLRSEDVDVRAVDAVVCAPCLTAVRVRYARAALERERGELSEVEHDIALRAANHIAIADEVERGTAPSPGQRAADRVALIGGSWRFVLGFSAFIVCWCVVNGVVLATGAFDPFPFILLNLMLSCLAALQAPIIMMSQARMAEIDRARAAQDFRINLKSELEIAGLHEKLDHVLHQQWDRMVELQDLQLEILEELRKPD